MNMWDVIYCLGTSQDTLGGVEGTSSEIAVLVTVGHSTAM